jgi:hypothetical protein
MCANYIFLFDDWRCSISGKTWLTPTMVPTQFSHFQWAQRSNSVSTKWPNSEVDYCQGWNVCSITHTSSICNNVEVFKCWNCDKFVNPNQTYQFHKISVIIPPRPTSKSLQWLFKCDIRVIGRTDTASSICTNIFLWKIFYLCETREIWRTILSHTRFLHTTI